MDVEEQVFRFVKDFKLENVPAEVKKKVTLCALDSLAALISGRHQKVAKVTAKYAENNWPEGHSTIISSGETSSCKGAAFANAYAANALDIDDCGLYTKGHPGAQLLSLTLAIAENKDLNGKEFLSDLIVGYEIAHRVGRCWHNYYDVYRAGGSWGSIVCCALASKRFNLNKEEFLSALGIAEYHAPYIPVMKAVSSPKMVKHGIGLGPLNGIMSAELAKLGFTGTPTMLFRDEYKKWFTDLGTNYIVEKGINWKEYCSCAWTHPALDAVTKIMTNHEFFPEDVKKIEVETFNEASKLGTDIPETAEEAQFNLAWPIASLIIHEKVGPDQVSGEGLLNEDTINLANKINLKESDKLTRAYHMATKGEEEGMFGSSVEIRMNNGEVYDSGVVEGNLKYPQPGWSKKRVKNKFIELTSNVVGTRNAKKMTELIFSLSNIESVEEITSRASRR